ncbi:hypothetical protein A3A39_03050 [Candidatus Kaiserbacteria bacterium RIFCSPLOWO2_01_FULL_54_13]|uniref:Glycosyltransferase RgtA/B/C/D-like domain-containing protein n=1 Tax=Candidatus Kaiserbacteria bacterium RIFCSPLOWO2_01_FULL_54_13 TaxID=1798512 RepID=A0A1F6F2F0_9BACT|nr:MAG: hypothetical protein A3A39_03050 [Candidatus Kaiserbacteria bacterium RIFCSPLOWO2_01_FULL_54_13]
MMLFVVSAFLFLYNLGGTALRDYDEAIYSQVIKDTLASGDIVTLSRFSSPWFEKPPLYFWSAMAVQQLIPAPEWAYRLPSALAGIASIALVMLIGFLVTRSYPIAFFAGLVLLTSPPFLAVVREVRHDAPVTAAILFTLYAFLKAKEEPRWYLGMGLGIALGVLTKSVIGLLAGPLILIWVVVQRDYTWVKNAYFWLGCALAVVLAAPWHIYEYVRYGAAFSASYLQAHILERFESNVIGGAVTGSNLTYITYLFTFALPWSVTTIAGLVPLSIMLRAGGAHLRSAVAFFLQILFLLAFFFLAATKLPYYLTLVYPFVALFLATVGQFLYEKSTDQWKKIVLGIAAFVFVAAFAQTINVGYHFHAKMRANDLLASDEKKIGLALQREEDLPVYAFKYDYWDTIRYYGGKRIQMMQEDQLLDEPFFLVLPRGFFDIKPFPSELTVRFTPLYVGEAVVLLRYDLIPRAQVL